ncbi:NB-ARC domain-containing protein [Streptomyces sp. NPDC054796]
MAGGAEQPSSDGSTWPTAQDGGAVRNEIAGTAVYGPTVMGRDIRDIVVNVGSWPSSEGGPLPFPDRQLALSAGPLCMVPARTHRIVPRAELADEIVARLLAEDGDGLVALTAVSGMGGIGKTTMAAECCRDPRTLRRFPDGVLWVTLGEQVEGAELAGKINNLASQLSGGHPPFTDPEQAGHHLGRLLADRRLLLVVDDIWRASQLAPFLLGGPGCRRLVTTRVRAALPDATDPVLVNAMTPGQAWELLTDGLPAARASDLAALFAGTGSWPVLLRLVNGALRRYVRGGLALPTAAARIARQLADRGPVAMDVTDADQRGAAVAATVEASLSLLDPARLQRYLELAVFPEDVAVPESTLAAYWAHTGGLGPAETERLCQDLADLSLVDLTVTEAEVAGDGPPTLALRLHDIMRAYLRHRAASQLRDLHRALLDAHRVALPREQSDDVPVEPSSEVFPWWRLPPQEPYLWRQLSHHLQQAELTAELNDVVCDPRWVLAVLDQHGPAPLESDLSRATGPLAEALGRAVTQNAHLLARADAAGGLGSTLLARLSGHPSLDAWRTAAQRLLPTPLLIPAWPLPDSHHPAFLRAFHHDTDSFHAVAISPDGTWVACAVGERTELWTLSGTRIGELPGTGELATDVAITPDGTIVTASLDGTVRLWNADGTPRVAPVGKLRSPSRVAISPDGSWFAVAHHDPEPTIHLWDADGTPRAVITGTGTVYDLTVSPDGSWLAACVSPGGVFGTVGHTVRFWDADGTPRRTIHGVGSSVYTLALSPCGTWLATGSRNIRGTRTSIRLWDIDGTPRGEIDDTSEVFCLTVSPDGSWLAAGTGHGAVHLWNTDGTARGVLSGHSEEIAGLAIGPDGSWLVSTSHDKTLRLWSVERAGRPPEGFARRVREVAAGPDGSWLAVVDGGRTVRLLSADGAELRDFAREGHADLLETVAIAPCGTWLAVAGSGGFVERWNSDGSLRAVIKEEEANWINALAIAPCGTWFAAAGEDGTVRLWEADGTPRGELPVCRGDSYADNNVWDVAIAPCGTWLATESGDGTVRLWEADGTPRATLGERTGLVYPNTVAIAPCGTWLAGPAEKGAVRLWHADGTPRATLTGHVGEVTGVAVSPDGRWLATSSRDKTLRLWDTATLRCVTYLRVDSALGRLTWFPSGDRLAVCGELGLYVFDVRT